VYYAGLALDDALAACGRAPELAAACATLAAWDRTANLDANLGYAYFAGTFRRIGGMSDLWAVPFSAADPINTPRGLNLANPAVAGALQAALTGVVQEVDSLGVPAGARWGDLQGVMRGERWIPIHGGEGELGVYNAIYSFPNADGRLKVDGGTSFIQTVAFEAGGPRAQAMLGYSQSTNPASPHFADQTLRFSQKAWITQAFTEAQIKADPAYTTVSISAPR
jgi:acyl-homoserine-lactone acylase